MSEPNPTAAGSESAPERQHPDASVGTITRDEVRVHRSPRYFRFMLAAVIVMAIVALILTFAYPEQAEYSRGQVFGFLLLAAIIVGLALGALIALVVGWVGRRRSRLVVAERLDVPADTASASEADPVPDGGEPTRTASERGGEAGS